MWYIFLTIVIVGIVLTFKGKKVLFHYHLKDLKPGDRIMISFGSDSARIVKVMYNDPKSCVIIFKVKTFWWFGFLETRRYGDYNFTLYKL